MKMPGLAILAGVWMALSAHAAEPLIVGEDVIKRYETPHPYTSQLEGRTGLVWSDVISYPGAAYIAPHFSRFHLAPGDYMIVRSPDGSRSWKYEGLGNAGLGESAEGFWGIDIPGETAIVELYAAEAKGEFGYTIDRFARGFRPEEMSSPEQICGADDSNWAKCYESSEPRIYDRGRAVARLLIAGSKLCTGWLIGNAGHLMTNAHCIVNTAEAGSTNFEFMAEGDTCTTNCPQLACPGTVVAVASTLIQRSVNLDFSLVQLPTNPSCTYGYVPLRSSQPQADERIYIPNHSAGKGKRIAVFSSDPADQSGYCEVNSIGQFIDCAGYPGIDVTYKADTEGGSSGSPVVAYADHKAIALHHCSLGSPCGSSGGQMTEIIAALGANLPPGALIDRAGSVSFDADVYGCADVTTVQVVDDTRMGAGTQAVTLASSAEPGGETVILAESPPGSGRFSGTVPTTSAPAVSGDGAISVVASDTISVSYVDVDGGIGCGSATRTDSATTDCTSPVISDVQVSNIQGSLADISWSTNEPSDSVVTYGPAGGPPTIVISRPTLVASHFVRVGGLNSCSSYVFRVGSSDAYGNAVVADNGGANYGFTTLFDVSPSFISSGGAVPIPDNDPVGATAALQVADSGTILDVNVKVNLSHTNDADLVVYLSGPDGTQVSLIGSRGGEGDNFVNTVLDDEATLSLAQGSAPFTGSFRPDGALSLFQGKSAAGTWTLRAADISPGNSGSILGFEVEITFQSLACFTSCSRESQSVVQDTCGGGGAGNGDGYWDDGEEAQLGVTLRNSGTLPLSGISATLVPLTPGVTLQDDTASYPDLAPGATAVSQSPHFRATLPLGFSCGSAIDFQVNIATAQGNFSDTARFNSGRSVIPTVLLESFSGGIPPAWTVVDGGTGTGPAATWTTANPGARAFVAPISDPVAVVDSDAAAGSGTQDEELITPILDLSAAVTVTLEFDQFFFWYDAGADEKGDVDVRSSRTGGGWVNVFRNQGASSAEPDHRTIDITSEAAGAANVQVRFHYYDADWEWYWEVDNVKVTHTEASSCYITSCNILAPPAEVASLSWPTKTSVAWTSVPGAATYNLYRGARTDLSALTSADVDSCRRATGVGLSASGLSEAPPAGSFTWWLVRAENTGGQGSAGSSRLSQVPTPRSQDSSGTCP